MLVRQPIHICLVKVYGLKETIVMDNAAELQKVELVDATGNGTMLSVDPAKNPMLAEAKAFGEVLREYGFTAK